MDELIDSCRHVLVEQALPFIVGEFGQLLRSADTHGKMPVVAYIRVAQKSKPLILSEYVNKTAKIGGM